MGRRKPWYLIDPLPPYEEAECVDPLPPYPEAECNSPLCDHPHTHDFDDEFGDCHGMCDICDREMAELAEALNTDMLEWEKQRGAATTPSLPAQGSSVDPWADC